MYESPEYSRRKKIFKTIIIVFFVILLVGGNIFLTNYLVERKVSKIKKIEQNIIDINDRQLEGLGLRMVPYDGTKEQVVFRPPAYFENKLKTNDKVDIGGSLNVGGDSALKNLSLSKNLTVDGVSLLQGPLTVSGLLTVDDNVSVLGELSVDGRFSTNRINVSDINVSDELVFSFPLKNNNSIAASASAGPAAGAGASASVKGNQVSGTIRLNTGEYPKKAGIIVNVKMAKAYEGEPKVLITAHSAGAGSVYVRTGSNGFSIGTDSSISRGTYLFDYWVVE
jgi:hypothetical protein